jgi:flagellar hook-associated protein 3 FlgL
MRVTGAILTNQALLAMRQALARLARSQAQIATGRRIQSPADDPAGHAEATRLQARLDATVQFRRQADRAQATLTATEALLQRVLPVLGRAGELAVSGADDAKGAQERAGLAAEVNGLLEELVSLANGADDGRYLLGGRETLTAPLAVTRDAAGNIVAAAWNPRGVDADVTIAIGPGASIRTNVGGTAALGAAADPTFVPALLIGLRDALLADDGAAVRATIDGLGAAGSRLGLAAADVGGRLRQVEERILDLETDRLAAEAALSAVLDADVARAAAALARQEIVYQAALNVTARAIQPTLMEFLR